MARLQVSASGPVAAPASEVWDGAQVDRDNRKSVENLAALVQSGVLSI